MTILVLVESPGKIQKIQKILGDGYIVKASVGHIRMLNPKNMSIELENNFKPIYIIDPKKKKVVNELKQIVKKCDKVLLAADEDREGEAIAQSLVEELKLKNYDRILFNEITKTAILNAVKNPGNINNHMVDSQKCRMILDKIVGYKLCPLLWQNIENRLSAGRVQSVVVKLIIDREEEIKKFNENSFYKIQINFKENNLKGNLNLISKKQKNKYVGEILKEKDVNKIKNLMELFKESKFKVKFILEKESIRNPSPPFITSSLQQEASSKLGFNVKKTMMIAQKLYEKGLITYMRTDSTNLSNDAINSCKKYICEKYGDEYFKQRNYDKKSKNAQEAHEAIRPTNCCRDKVNVESDENKLYNLIWKQTIASQMESAKIKILILQIEIDNIDEYYVESTFEEIIFLGYLILFGQEIIKIENIPKKNDMLNYGKIKANQ